MLWGAVRLARSLSLCTCETGADLQANFTSESVNARLQTNKIYKCNSIHAVSSLKALCNNFSLAISSLVLYIVTFICKQYLRCCLSTSCVGPKDTKCRWDSQDFGMSTGQSLLNIHRRPVGHYSVHTPDPLANGMLHQSVCV